MNRNAIKSITILTVLLLVSLTIVSIFGAFVPATYEKDAPSMAAQGIGQDLVNLFIVTPLLLLSLIYLRRNNRIATLVFGGTIFYILYSFFIYAFGVHFNQMFLLYCITLGLSLYVFIMYLIEVHQINTDSWFKDNFPVKPFAWFLIIVSFLFYFLWLKDVVPAILGNYTPKTVSDYSLLVNPVHVLDIAIALPGLIITASLLSKKHKLGFILTPVALVFILILTVALIGMVVMLKLKDINEDLSIAAIFLFLALISTFFLVKYFRNINT